MRLLIALSAACVFTITATAQQQELPDLPAAEGTALEVIGCVDGSLLTETSLYVGGAHNMRNPAAQWRLSAPREVLRQLEEMRDREVRIIGIPEKREETRGTVIVDRPIGERARVFVGNSPRQTQPRDRRRPPTLRVVSASAAPSSSSCQ